LRELTEETQGRATLRSGVAKVGMLGLQALSRCGGSVVKIGRAKTKKASRFFVTPYCNNKFLVGLAGFEPATNGLKAPEAADIAALLVMSLFSLPEISPCSRSFVT